MCGFDCVQRGNYFRGEPIKTEVEVRVRKLKNGKATGKDEVMGEIINGPAVVRDNSHMGC